MASLVNNLILTLDHSLFRKHMQKVHPEKQKSWNIEFLKWNWRDFAPFKISLAVLYSIVWIWDLTGKVLYSIVWIWGLTGKILYSIVWIWGITGNSIKH